MRFFNSLLVFILIHASLVAYGSPGKEQPVFSYKEVIIKSNSTKTADYEYGKNLYPDYSSNGLPDNFLIKKQPDILFYKSDIKSVTISKGLSLIPDVNFYDITLKLTISASKKLYEYTKQNLKEKVAMEINGKIFVIATIISPLSETLTIGGCEKTIPEIKAEFYHISNKIIVNNK